MHIVVLLIYTTWSIWQYGRLLLLVIYDCMFDLYYYKINDVINSTYSKSGLYILE